MYLSLALQYFLPFFCIFQLNSATPLTGSSSLESSPLTNINTSASTNASIEGFATSPTWNDTLLPNTACLLTSIFALQDLALQDFTSTAYATNTWQLAAYPELSISTTPPPNQNHTTVRWAVWGIASAISTMLTEDRYETADFDLMYHGASVGFVNYSDPEIVPAPITKPQIEAESAPFATTENEISVSPLERVNNSAPITYTLANPASNTTSNTSTLQIAVSFTPLTIDQSSYFATIINALETIAPTPANMTILNWSFATPTSPDEPEINFTAVHREGAPFFQIGHVVRALGALPGILLQRGMWNEADVDVFVGGVVVGRGVVRRGEGSVGLEDET